MPHNVAPLSPLHKRVVSSSRIMCLVLALAVPTLLFGQSFTASVRGVVTDSAQAAVPAAKVTVTDVDRNLEHKTQADAMGRYVIMALPPGAYTLSAEAAGFQKFARSAFVLGVQQQATIDVELTVGQIATAVEVQAAAPLLNATSADLSYAGDRGLGGLSRLGRHELKTF